MKKIVKQTAESYLPQVDMNRRFAPDYENVLQQREAADLKVVGLAGVRLFTFYGIGAEKTEDTS